MANAFQHNAFQPGAFQDNLVSGVLYAIDQNDSGLLQEQLRVM